MSKPSKADFADTEVTKTHSASHSEKSNDLPSIGKAEANVWEAHTELTHSAKEEVTSLVELLLSNDNIHKPDLTEDLKEAIKENEAVLAPDKGALDLTLAQDESAELNSWNTADSALQSATTAWGAAVKTYHYSRTLANKTMTGAVQASAKAYHKAYKSTDSPSKRLYLYHQTRGQVVAAVTAYESSMAAAQATLASAMADLLNACVLYRSSATSAAALKAANNAIAEVTYWQQVEQTLGSLATS